MSGASSIVFRALKVCGLVLAALPIGGGVSLLAQESPTPTGTVLPGATPTATAEPLTTPTISGVVFHDLDGDGVRDEGEPGLPNKAVSRRQGDVMHRGPITDPDGTYRMDMFPPGQYILEAALDGGVGICADIGSSFHPLVRSFCFNFTLPWNATTANPLPVTVGSGAALEIDFGAQPADVAVVAGNALLEAGFASAGTLIEALVDGQECGTTTVTDDADLNFEIHVLGSGERAGCAVTGDRVDFRVGGVPAAGTFTWVSFIDTPGLGHTFRNLVAMEEHAWYWMERISDGFPAEDVVVQALVDGVVCGEALLRAPRAAGDLVGFSRLVVPADTVEPGCGRAGATVSFLVGDVEVETAVPWMAGLQQIDLAMPRAAPTPTATVPPDLPGAGLGGASGSGFTRATFPLLVLLLGAGFAALVAGLAGRRAGRAGPPDFTAHLRQPKRGGGG